MQPEQASQSGPPASPLVEGQLSGGLEIVIRSQAEHSLEFGELLLDMGKQERITGYEVLVLLHLYNRGVTVMSCHA